MSDEAWFCEGHRVYDESRLTVAYCSSEDDARLIAAAPGLLAALRAVVSVADRKTDEFDLAHAAIAKATNAE